MSRFENFFSSMPNRFEKIKAASRALGHKSFTCDHHYSQDIVFFIQSEKLFFCFFFHFIES